MKSQEYIQAFIRNHDKKESFLIGTFISFFTLMGFAVVSNHLAGNIRIVYFESFFMLCIFVSFIYYMYSKNLSFGVHSLIIFATLISYALLIEDEYRLSLFHVIVPLNYFFLFSLRRSLLYTLIHEIIVVLIYTYGYFHYDGLPNVIYHGNILSIVMASLVVIFFGVVYHISIESSYKRLEKSNYQKEILLNEIHHRIKNSLHFISSLLGLQQKDEKDPKLTKIFEKNRLRIHSIAMIHEALYKYESFEEIAFDTYTKKLCDTILELYSNKTVVTIQESNVYLSTQDTLRFGIITNELLTNSLKHAFNKEAGEVTISLTKTEDAYIYNYHDNGKIEIDEKEFMKDDTLGLKIIHMMVEQMEGELKVSFDGGFGFEVKTLHS